MLGRAPVAAITASKPSDSIISGVASEAKASAVIINNGNLTIQDYAKVTLVDIRYIQIDVLERFLEFKGQDVLFLYSTLVLNNSSTIK